MSPFMLALIGVQEVAAVILAGLVGSILFAPLAIFRKTRNAPVALCCYAAGSLFALIGYSAGPQTPAAIGTPSGELVQSSLAATTSTSTVAQSDGQVNRVVDRARQQTEPTPQTVAADTSALSAPIVSPHVPAVHDNRAVQMATIKRFDVPLSPDAYLAPFISSEQLGPKLLDGSDFVSSSEFLRNVSPEVRQARIEIMQRAISDTPAHVLGSVYEDRLHGFRVSIPKGWTATEIDGDPWLVDIRGQSAIISIAVTPQPAGTAVDLSKIERAILERANAVHARVKDEAQGFQYVAWKFTAPVPMTNGNPILTQTQYFVPLPGKLMQVRLASVPDERLLTDNELVMLKALSTLQFIGPDGQLIQASAPPGAQANVEAR